MSCCKWEVSRKGDHLLKKLGVKGRRLIGEGSKRQLRILREVNSKKEISVYLCECACVCAHGRADGCTPTGSR